MAAANISAPQPTGFESHYLNEQTADVFFVCKSDNGDVRVPAHKFILSVKSPPFHAMFFGTLAEKGDITIPITAAAFKEFLKFSYFSDVQPAMDSIRDVVNLLKQYQMAHGLEICANFLKKNLTQTNFLFVLELASLYDMLDLKQYCEIRAPVLLTSESLHTCTQDELKRILQIRQLNAEFNLVEVCEEWARRACEKDNVDASNVENIRKYLGDIIDHIDFRTMSTQNIQESIDSYEELLSKGALIQMIKALLERAPAVDRNYIVWCTQRSQEKRIIKRFETMKIQGTYPFMLKAVGFTSILKENEQTPQEVHGQLVITRHSPDDMGNSDIVVLREVLNFETRSPHVHVHRFESSIFIEDDVEYSLQVQLSLQDIDQFYVHSEYRDVIMGPRGMDLDCEGNTIISSLGIGLDISTYG